ncbi:TetR family transcriptional regulator [Tsukamurella tyrosinosolvens]|uniref:TetR/AcrR family transcriptional regulator n=1 Tax=Tsukamurella tyrosinosolvens TaxID=57704 RepID=UPI0008397EB1|nr:TetR family transcriptional regulator [Tsukamurella tyrosinosolvens]MCA4996627.1 TetR family transcriptional regulator [Tsukamurella tyrosinosolvens]MEC4612975.1 TetR family transcriptional regulator [Tsukamurella tyrosinosolvens]RDB45693.1 TetR/AcrR family transcriptional regulator [Tsukamurella tyrosinosolvens]
MPPDATETKRRILDAARREFAEFGLAGARIDRIADQASANKRSIYVHFGPKEDLFDLIVVDSLRTMADAVRFDADDLPGYAGRLYDYLLAEPSTLRLSTWANLERPSSTDDEGTTYREKVDALRPHYGDGAVDALVLTLGLVTAWPSASPALTSLVSPDDAAGDTIAARRAIVVAAVDAVAATLGTPPR